MAIQSMTGFGEGKVSSKGVSIITELSSVNRKQLDIQIHIPRNMVFLEPIVQKEIKKVIFRGRITGSLQLKDVSAASAKININHKLAKEYKEAFRIAAKKIGAENNISFDMIMRQSDIIQVQANMPHKDIFEKSALQSLRKALKELKRMRNIEGEELAQDIKTRLKSLEKITNIISGRAPKLVVHYQKKLLSRLKEYGVDELPKDERIFKEIALFSDRSDISEELTRIFSHIKQINTLLYSNKPAGRPVDFLCQELFREINTIGSKAPDIQLTKAVVKFKTELERIREQVQNVE